MIKVINKNILIWIIVILAVLNISTIGTIVYRRYFSENSFRNNSFRNNINHKNKFDENKIPDRHLGRFFRDELDLSREQHEQFRYFRRKYHRQAYIIKSEMQSKRNDIMRELSKEVSDTLCLQNIADEIGGLHIEIKHLTFKYYLEMKSICDDKQKEKLFKIFNKMANKNADINMPNRRR